MKTILTLLLACYSMAAFGSKATFKKLAEVNKCWTEQKDVPQLPACNSLSEREWIKLHLSLAERTLRSRDMSHLTAAQKQKRLQSLNDLHRYWLEGNFPVNDEYAFRTPIFIDKYNNFCAVGYLVKASGHEKISRMIAANTNLAYVRQMNYPELNAWANDYGFTTDELAWIQPGYPPVCNAKPVGGGTNGEIMDMFADEAEGKLYIGGNFTKVDGNINAGNIACVTMQGGTYKWHSMSTGVNGPVYAIEKFDNKIFIAGEFTLAGSTAVHNIAYWDGSAWQPFGCTYGRINDLLVYKGELYAAGDFDVCAALAEVNFARWNGSNWQQMPGLTGHVNTMAIWNEKIVLGGSFEHTSAAKNVITWDPNNWFTPFNNNIVNEVKDLEIFKGDLYAATKFSGSADSALLKKLTGQSWTTEPSLSFADIDNTITYNTLCAQADTLVVGGNFNSGGMILVGSGISNCFNLNGGDWFLVDDEINKLVVFQGKLFAGGKFTKDTDNPTIPLNGIGFKEYKFTNNIPEIPRNGGVNLYPNPVKNSLNVNNTGEELNYNIYDLQGRKALSGTTQKEIDVQTLQPGHYLIRVEDKKAGKTGQFVKE